MSSPTALVTGGAKRIGAAIALELAQHGYDVVIHYNSSDEAAQATASAIEALGQQAWLIAADLGEPDAAEGLVAAAEETAGRPMKFIVNNASTFPRIRLPSMTYHDVDTMMRLHAWAPLAIARSATDAAAIVNLLDTRIGSHDPDHFPYLMSKQVLADLTRSLAKELAPTRVNGVAPGPILEPSDGSHSLDAAVQATVLKRQGTPEEVAAAVRFLLEAEYVTGNVLFVDGGRHLRSSA